MSYGWICEIMNCDLISVVVPVYKVEKYINRCVDSILRQTYTNIEIILVDDGSPDRCGEICDEYKKKDSRISVIHKENGGLSDARNAGTLTAKGTYITYIDSDDWVADEYIEILYSAIKKNNCSLSVCGFIKVSDYKTIGVIKDKLTIFNNVEALQEMLYQKSFDNSACGKLYETSIMQNNLFPVGKWYEDLFTIYKVLAQSGDVVYVDSQLYYYWTNPNSIMHSSFDLRMFDEIEAVDNIVGFVKTNMPKIAGSAYSRKFSSYSQVLRWIPRDIEDKEIKKKEDVIWKFIKEYRFKMMLDRKARFKNRVAAFVSLFGKELFCKI